MITQKLNRLWTRLVHFCLPVWLALAILFSANMTISLWLGHSLLTSLIIGSGNTILAYALLIPLLRDRDRVAQQLRDSEAKAMRGYKAMLQFAYIAAHDLQSPLATIAGFAGLLLKEYGNKLDESGNKYINFLVDEAQSASRKVEGLLQLSRIDTQGKPFALVKTRDRVERAVSSLRAELAAAGGLIDIDHLPDVIGDGQQLERVFLNLIGNAIKYRHPDRKLKVFVNGYRQPGATIFLVEDNGQGIPNGYEDKIFAIFGRLHDSTTPGDGIGLAVVKRIVERHGGRLWFDGKNGDGSLFYFSISD